MKRILPCPRCNGAKLTDGAGKQIPYVMGLAPSAFRTPGVPFSYTCLGCKSKLQLTKMAFYALPDLDPPVPAALPDPDPPVQPVFEPEKVVAASAIEFIPDPVVNRPAPAAKKKPAVKEEPMPPPRPAEA